MKKNSWPVQCVALFIGLAPLQKILRVSPVFYPKQKGTVDNMYQLRYITPWSIESLFCG